MLKFWFSNFLTTTWLKASGWWTSMTKCVWSTCRKAVSTRRPETRRPNICTPGPPPLSLSSKSPVCLVCPNVTRRDDVLDVLENQWGCVTMLCFFLPYPMRLRDLVLLFRLEVFTVFTEFFRIKKTKKPRKRAGKTGSEGRGTDIGIWMRWGKWPRASVIFLSTMSGTIGTVSRACRLLSSRNLQKKPFLLGQSQVIIYIVYY